MEDRVKDPELTAEIAVLRKQQRESTIRATFLGWNPETSAAHEERSNHIAALVALLAASPKNFF